MKELLTDLLEYHPLRAIIFILGVLGFVAFNAAYLVWLERKGSGHFQGRIGPKEVGPFGLLQPVADGIKLLSKQLLIPPGADAILFRLAPVLVMVPAITSFATIPFSEKIFPANINVGLLMIFAFASVNVMGLMLGGWSSRNKYAVIASARVVSQNVAYEIPMLLTVVTVVMMTKSFNLSEIVASQGDYFWTWNVCKVWVNPFVPLTFLVFYICMLAETNRAPFDMAETESELVAGAFTEYSGMGFGVFFMGEYANIVIGCCLATILFLGGWSSPIGFEFLIQIPYVGWLFAGGVHWFLLKMYFLCFSVIWIRWTFPRTQFYGLLNLSWKILIPFSLINLVLTAFVIKLHLF